ncbi:hypothetical protein CHUAL_013147 [Chamberlinius hualienensis]
MRNSISDVTEKEESPSLKPITKTGVGIHLFVNIHHLPTPVKMGGSLEQLTQQKKVLGHGHMTILDSTSPIGDWNPGELNNTNNNENCLEATAGLIGDGMTHGV